ncbi:ribonuclease H-like domain-containing protein [Tanacetum coccineum]
MEIGRWRTAVKDLSRELLFVLCVPICDTKNKVLFIDKECLCSPQGIQLPDSSQVVLRVPRRHNLYCFKFDTSNSEEKSRCCWHKQPLDDVYKWHRRMAHSVNFKNMNKLENRISQWPSLPKLFTNAHNCVAAIKESNTRPLPGPSLQDYSVARTPQQNRVAERKNRTLIEAARTMLADSKLPTMFWTEAVSTACYVKADEGFLVGTLLIVKLKESNNLSNKKIEETLNLRYMEDKPNVQGLGHEWYFDLDYLTDSLGYTRFKSNQPAGTQDTNTHAGTHDDSDSECDEQVIVVPSNHFSGPKVHTASATVESTQLVQRTATIKDKNMKPILQQRILGKQLIRFLLVVVFLLLAFLLVVLIRFAWWSAVPSTSISSVVRNLFIADQTPHPPVTSIGLKDGGIHHILLLGSFSASTLIDFGVQLTNLAPTIALTSCSQQEEGSILLCSMIQQKEQSQQTSPLSVALFFYPNLNQASVAQALKMILIGGIVGLGIKQGWVAQGVIEASGGQDYAEVFAPFSNWKLSD